MSTRIAINGFGRIGRLAFRNFMEREGNDLEVAAINDVAPLDNLAYLLRHDTVQRDPDASRTCALRALLEASAEALDGLEQRSNPTGDRPNRRGSSRR